MGVVAAALLVFGTLYYAGSTQYLLTFLSITLFSVLVRVLVVLRSRYYSENKLARLANWYVGMSLLIGCSFAAITVFHYDVQNENLQLFLTIVNLAMITAAVGSLAVWYTAYLAFSLPQMIGLFTVFYLQHSLSIFLAVFVFSVFMLAVARGFNRKFKEGRLLIEENIKLIGEMKNEIHHRQQAQQQLEQHQQQLESIVKDRTQALENINRDLKDQIKKREVVEKELEYLAYYDELTSLPNRSLFIEELKNSLLQAKRHDTLLGVMFIDLDRFKKINDSYSHYIGDKLLKVASSRLKGLLRESDVIARNGGDEFIVYLENMHDAREPFVVANKIIECMNKKFEVEGHTIHIGASVGVALYPLDGDDAVDLVKKADTAMYEAKKQGRNNFQFYSSSMSAQIADRLKIENALHSALENDEFFLVYQPQVSLVTGETTGFEALLRWKNPEFGIVSPIKFIPVLEETGLIYEVGEWIIREVLKFISSGKSANKKVSINLSALQCSVVNYSNKILEMIAQAKVDASLVEFEITESLLIKDFSQTEMFLSDISEMGCSIALDDFGTGYTSFGYLAKLPIDIIKVDRSLVMDIHIKKELENIVRAIITMSTSLGISNVFEGIESREELDVIRRIGGEIIQGYYYSKPLSVDEVKDWNNRNSQETKQRVSGN